MSANVLPALIGALVGGAVTALGWIINYYLGRSKDIDLRQREARLRYIQQQIEEFYAPLWSLTEQSRIVYEIAKKRLPLREDGTPDNSRFTAEEHKIFGFFNDNYFLRINSQVAEILRKKVYLLHEGVMPESFADFIEHQTLSESLYQLWREKGVDSSMIKGKRYPSQFGKDIKATLDVLRQQYIQEINLVTRRTRSGQKE